MANELFVDGICELDDKTVQSYFSQFGSRITAYDSHRHRPTNSCCFALISFTSSHTVNAILRKRPHSIHHYTLFVKRILPANVCSFTERLLPVTSLFVYNKITKDYNEKTLKSYFKTYGRILKFERDYGRDRLFIEYDDYDSVDKIFLNKDQLPSYIDIHKNILPLAQSTIEYHGTCRRKQEKDVPDEKQKKLHHKKKFDLDDQYEDLLQKTIKHLTNCKSQLKNKENDHIILEIEYNALKEKYEKLNQLVDYQNKLTNSCLSCKEYELTIDRLQKTLLKLNEKHDTMKLQYQQLLSTQHISNVLPKSEYDISTPKPIQHRQYLLSTRLNNDENYKNEASERSVSQSQFNLSKSGCCDTVIKQENSPSPIMQSHIHQHRITYNYESVKSDED